MGAVYPILASENTVFSDARIGCGPMRTMYRSLDRTAALAVQVLDRVPAFPDEVPDATPHILFNLIGSHFTPEAPSLTAFPLISRGNLSIVNAIDRAHNPVVQSKRQFWLVPLWGTVPPPACHLVDLCL